MPVESEATGSEIMGAMKELQLQKVINKHMYHMTWFPDFKTKVAFERK